MQLKFSKIYSVLLLFLALNTVVLASPSLIRIPKPFSEHDTRHDYYVQLLHKALAKAANGRELPIIQETMVMEQNRAVHELLRGDLIDLYMLGTDVFKEKNLRAIRIPLDRGLLGYRKFIIRESDKPVFDKIRTLNDLKRYAACQSDDWPDTAVLRSAGLIVRTSVGYENLFKQIAGKRCDYFPRGFYEGDPELRERHYLYPDLIYYDQIVLHYPFTIYFFVRKNNEELAQWIEQGLEKMIDDGEFMHHMKTHPATAQAFPLTRKKSVTFIDIDNALMSKDTDFNNSRYWFLPSDFGVIVRN